MEITLKEFFAVIKKGIVFIVATALVFAVCSFFVSNFFIKKTYTTSVKLYVDTKIDSQTSNYYNSYNYAVSLVNTYKEMLQTNKFYAMVSEDLNKEYTATQLSHAISFSSLNDTEVFKATIVASTPESAKAIADSVAKNAPEVIANLNETATLKIVDEATVPTSPSSPNVTKNTFIAFIVGFVLAVLVVFIRKVFDVKICYSEDITTLCGVPVLSAIPDFGNITNSENNKSKRSV